MSDPRIVRYRGVLCIYWRDERGLPQRRSLGTTDWPEAKRRFADSQALDNRSPVTVSAIWHDYVKAYEGRTTAVRMGFEWKWLKQRFGDLHPSQVTEQHCLDHIKERRALGRRDGTIWTELKDLRGALQWWKARNPAESIGPVVLPAKPEPKADYLTRDQFDRYLAACEFPHVRLFVILAISTAARKAALLELKWDQVDFERGQIRLASAESGERKKGRATVPMTDALRAALSEARTGAVTPYVIEWAGNRPRSKRKIVAGDSKPLGSVRRALDLAGERSGLPWVTPHVFRHSAAVWLAEAGNKMEEIAQFLGHSDSRITERVYARYSPDHLKKAAKALEISTLRRVG